MKSSATMSQWNSFAVVPYCKRSVMRFLGEGGRVSSRRVRTAKRVCAKGDSSGLRQSHGGVRHRIDRTGAGGAFARAGIASRHRKCIAHDRLDDETIGGRRQSKTQAEVYAEVAEFEIRDGEQGVLLIGKLRKVSDLAKVGVIFEPDE